MAEAGIYHTNYPRLLDLTADYADCADTGNISAISEIRGQQAWAAFSEKYKSQVCPFLVSISANPWFNSS